MSDMTPISGVQSYGSLRAPWTQAAPAPRGELLNDGRVSDSSVTSSGVDEFKRRWGEAVGMALIGPVIRQMQDSPFKTKYAHGGRGEEVFGGQLALELSKRVGRTLAQRMPAAWVEAVAQRYGGADRLAALEADATANRAAVQAIRQAGGGER